MKKPKLNSEWRKRLKAVPIEILMAECKARQDERMTKLQRQERGRNAAEARWRKAKEKQK